MKKSKAFFGITAFILAIVGAFASKASIKVTSITGYSLLSSGACAAAHVGLSCTTTPGNYLCKILSNGALRTIYTRFTTIVGGNQLFSSTNKLWEAEE